MIGLSVLGRSEEDEQAEGEQGQDGHHVGNVRSHLRSKVHDGQPDEAESQRGENDSPESVFETVVVSAGGSGRGSGGACEVEVS